MKRLIALVLLLCLTCTSAYADQADDLIATLTDSNKASVASAVAKACLGHRDGEPYDIEIRLRTKEENGLYTFTTVECSFTEEEYEKLCAWCDGEYEAPDGETDSLLKGVSALVAESQANKWKLEHGYDFPIYGSTSVDLSPISDYLTMLSDNGIYITLPELNILHDHEEYEWIYSSFSDFWFLYQYYNDGTKYAIRFQVPNSYKPQYEALVYLMVSVLDIDYEEADELMQSLQYNVIDHTSSIKTEEYELTYFENAKIGGFLVLSVTKITK